MASKHAREHEARPPVGKKKRKKKKEKKFPLLGFKRFWFICAGVSNLGGYKRNTLI